MPYFGSCAVVPSSASCAEGPESWNGSEEPFSEGPALLAEFAAPLPRRAGWRQAAVLSLPLLGVGAWLGTRQRSSLRLTAGGASWIATEDCLHSEEDVDYWTKASLYEIQDIQTERLCAEKCAVEPRCGAWTWGKQRDVPGLTDVCFLKELKKQELPFKHEKKGVVSGMRPENGCADPAPATDDSAGWVKSKHGICLSAPSSGILGEKVHMSSCDISDENQLWTFDKESGQLRASGPKPAAPEGVCLTAKAGDVEYSMVLIENCEGSNSNQQWSYSESDSQIVLWHGMCLNAPEPASDSSSVDMRKCDAREEGQRWAIGKEMGRLYYDDRSYVNGTFASSYQSMFCFALMLPGSYEEELLSWQLQVNASLFACDTTAIYSNKAIHIGKGFKTSVVDSSLKCENGGEFQTALNLPIFLVVWTKVIEDGLFMNADWTVKVDPDTVFIAPRLREMLQAHPETKDGVYINNCKFGLHGPLEVFSRNAVKAWAMGSEKCVDHFTQLCNGDCAWGEDMFIDQCLSRVLKLQRDSDFRLLVEDHCDPPDGWKSCDDQSYASYHPFKSVADYRTCYRKVSLADELAREGGGKKR